MNIMGDEPFLSFIEVFANLATEVGVEYFSDGMDLDLSVHQGELTVTNIRNVFTEDISPRAICMKLAHNLEMLKSFRDHYPIDTSNLVLRRLYATRKC